MLHVCLLLFPDNLKIPAESPFLQYLTNDMKYQGVPYRQNDGTKVTDNMLTIIQRLVCHEIVMLEVFR